MGGQSERRGHTVHWGGASCGSSVSQSPGPLCRSWALSASGLSWGLEVAAGCPGLCTGWTQSCVVGADWWVSPGGHSSRPSPCAAPQFSASSTTILDEEPIVNRGLAAALLLCQNKGEGLGRP